MPFYTATEFCTPGLIKSMAFGFKEASDWYALIPQIFTQCFVFSVTQEHILYSISWRGFAKLASISGPMFILIKQRSCQWSTRHGPWHTRQTLEGLIQLSLSFFKLKFMLGDPKLTLFQSRPLEPDPCLWDIPSKKHLSFGFCWLIHSLFLDENSACFFSFVPSAQGFSQDLIILPRRSTSK